MLARIASLASFVLALSACTGAPTDAPDAAVPPTDTGPRPDAATWMLDPAPEANLVHAFPPVDLVPGDERLELCQAWTLDNETPIYVSSVTMDAGPGWHHSNWMWVPDTAYAGADGTFPCRDRDFNELDAGLAHGGGVFFAQSTQATHEVQSFGPGAAYMIPPHARVIGAIHVFNGGSADVSTGITFTVHGLASDDVLTLLHGVAIDNRNIDIAAHSTTAVEMSCNFANAVRTHRLTQHIHYVLPHFHGLATGFEIHAVGGPHDGELVFGTSTGIGDPLGSTFTTPFDLTDAAGLRMRCTYENPGDTAVDWGVYRTDEMCVALLYVDGPVQLVGGSNGPSTTTTDPDGTTLETSTCVTVAR